MAFARGVLVAQSARDGGAMNAFWFAVEQKKPVATFAADDSEGTSGNSLIAAESWTKTLPGNRSAPDSYLAAPGGEPPDRTPVRSDAPANSGAADGGRLTVGASIGRVWAKEEHSGGEVSEKYGLKRGVPPTSTPRGPR